MVDNQTAYIKIDRFMESTYQEFRNILTTLKNQGAKRLMLDLRGNPGGYKDRAEKVVDELLGGDKMIVYTDGKGTQYDSKTMTKFDGIFEKGQSWYLLTKIVLRHRKSWLGLYKITIVP
jgi:carboxyl-terminal processing protease